MSRRNYVFTSESVSEGHPDKICDRISDAVVDAFITQMPEARVACETMATTNRVFIAGETRGPAEIDASAIMSIARDTIRDIGYEQDGFHWRHCDINVHLHAQSPEIAQGVDAQSGKDEGAGDQGIMFGYACRETEALMPAPIHYAHRILQNIADARKSGGLNMLGPDAKSQVSVRYQDGRPVGIDSLVISTQHLDASLTSQDIRQLIEPYVRDLIPEGWISAETSWHINPTGKFVIGGPDGDCGITGRKIIVDTYGGAAPHGGGAFSGKDPTKVDRSAAYLARYMAKNIVAAGFAERCTIQLSYAIGVSQPLSLYVDLHDTGTIEASLLEKILRDLIDMSPRGIRLRLGLNRPIYSRTAAYGHFGREPEADGGFSWERIDLVDALRKAV